MLFTLIIVFFVLGFGTAIIASTDLKNIKPSINRFLDNVRLCYDFLHSRIFLNAQGTAAIVKDEKKAKDGKQFLMTRADVETRYEVGTWQHVAFEELKSTLLARERDSKKFPCVYATMGFRSNDHRYIFVDSDNPSEPRKIKQIGPAIRAYLTEAHNLGPNTSLVIICAPSDQIRTVGEYNNRFWDFLRGLRICDFEAWPEDVPAKTTDEHWTFCFNGEPLFPIALTPAHEKRRSRYASNLMIAMQPKWVIDNLMSTPEKRQSATSMVRGLLEKYDSIEVSPDLSNYGDTGTSESRQLTLLDENETSECLYEDFDV